jgi:hypothetical protein
MNYKLLQGAYSFDTELLHEQANPNEEKKFYINGIFGETEAVNKNGRLYQKEEMEKEILRFNDKMIPSGTALNELRHPESPEVNPEKVCDRTVKLYMDGNLVMGKALVLDTPMGKIERTIMEGGGKLGKSSRSLGQVEQVKKESSGLPNGEVYNKVSNLNLICFDTVTDPSVATAMVDHIVENKEWIIANDGSYKMVSQNTMNDTINAYSKLEESLKTLPKHESQAYLRECFVNFIKSL